MILTHRYARSSQQGSLRINPKMPTCGRSNQDCQLTYPPYRRNHSWRTPED